MPSKQKTQQCPYLRKSIALPGSEITTIMLLWGRALSATVSAGKAETDGL